LVTLALGGFATPSATSVSVEPVVVLAASTHSVSPAGWCAFGHNPDGSCRGHRQAAAGKRCIKYGRIGYKKGKETGEKVGTVDGAVVGGIGGKGNPEAIANGAEQGKKLNGTIGKWYGAGFYCVLYASDSNWDK
jgi:hypothetical protein